MLKTAGFTLVLVAATLPIACQTEATKQWTSPPAMRIDVNRHYTATLETDLGTITVELQPVQAPNTVNNFVFLAREGFYDGVSFHRVIRGFMVQTGDPSGTGRGGPGYRIVDEPVAESYVRGVVAMANAGQPNTAGSQFFIVQGEEVFLPRTYTVFGKVTDGLDIVDQIASVPVGPSPSGEMSAPQQDVRIQKVRVSER